MQTLKIMSSKEHILASYKAGLFVWYCRHRTADVLFLMFSICQNMIITELLLYSHQMSILSRTHSAKGVSTMHTELILLLLFENFLIGRSLQGTEFFFC